MKELLSFCIKDRTDSKGYRINLFFWIIMKVTLSIKMKSKGVKSVDEEVVKLNEEIETTTQLESEKKYLTCWIDGQLFGISVLDIVQIVGIQAITPIPNYPVYCKGILYLRGNAIPLVDARLRLNKPEIEYTDRTCIVIVKIEEQSFGFIVDGVEEVVDIPETQISLPVQIGDGEECYIIGIAELEKQADKGKSVILCLDIKKVFNEKIFHKKVEKNEN